MGFNSIVKMEYSDIAFDFPILGISQYAHKIKLQKLDSKSNKDFLTAKCLYTLHDERQYQGGMIYLPVRSFYQLPE